MYPAYLRSRVPFSFYVTSLLIIELDMFATEPESVMEQLLYKTDNFDQTALHYACFSSLELALLLVNRSSVDKLVSMFG